MNNINLISLIQAYDSLEENLLEDFKKSNKVGIENYEIDDLKKLLQRIKEDIYSKDLDITLFDNFYVGYQIPQISKEFDLLRVGEEDIVGIELKKKSTEEKILTQLKKNKYYLKSLGKETYLFTFVSDTEKLFFLDSDDQLIKVEIESLIEALKKQKNIETGDLNNIFNPTSFLVSPFNSTEKFLKNEYFLTVHQQGFKKEIIKKINEKRKSLFDIKGTAGTGKTLLIYDIAKSLKEEGKKVLIIHCGNLNSGHRVLIENDWDIIPIKDYNGTVKLEDFEIIIFDELQRIYVKQFEEILEKNKTITYIFSWDKRQIFSIRENPDKVEGEIESFIRKNNFLREEYKLTKTIRTNKNIANFIEGIFNKHKSIKTKKKYVSFSYFNNIEDAKKSIKNLMIQEWKYINFSTSLYGEPENHEKMVIDTEEDTSHKIIGQEFDNIIILIDEEFKYGEDGLLYYNSPAYYSVRDMLFQNLTRARKKIHVVIVNNPSILDRCVKILE